MVFDEANRYPKTAEKVTNNDNLNFKSSKKIFSINFIFSKANIFFRYRIFKTFPF